MMTARRVLVVDNDASACKATALRLATRGYTVSTATSVEQARRLLAEKYFQLAVVDIRLEDERDEMDTSGLALAREINSFIITLIITGYKSFDYFRNFLGSAANGFTPADLIFKEDGPQALLSAVERAFQGPKRINWDLEIEERGISFRELVRQIKEFQRRDESSQEEAGEELCDLLRKLFLDETKIEISFMRPGRGGSGIVLVKPYYQGMEGAPIVAKFGARESMAHEIACYKQYVEPFVLPRSTSLVGQPALTNRLGACKFRFVGLSRDHLQDFNAYYRDPRVADGQVVQAIADLFEHTCKIWYKGKRGWSTSGNPIAGIRIGEFYRRQLSFDQAENWQELQQNLDKIVQSSARHGVIFQRIDDTRLEMQVEDCHPVTLLDPLVFLRDHEAALPQPSFRSVTHGDLNSRNIFVDEGGRTWLIDFFRTGWGPVLRDVGELESGVKFELLQTSDFARLYAFEQAVLAPDRFDQPIELNSHWHTPEFVRAIHAIAKLRSIAADLSETQDVGEHYVGLLYYALKMMTWRGISSVDVERQAIRARHALLSAALICEKLRG